VPGNPLKVECRYCEVKLNASFSEVKSHSKTSKHARNVLQHASSIVEQGNRLTVALPIKSSVYARSVYCKLYKLASLLFVVKNVSALLIYCGLPPQMFLLKEGSSVMCSY